MQKLVSVVGARPQFIKAATLHKAIEKTSSFEEIIVHTGQHYDDNMSRIFFQQLELPKPNYNLKVSFSKHHGEQIGRILEKIELILIKEQPDIVVVYGDANSTLAGALSATKLHIPVAHVEAGVRSGNRQMPEEINRLAVDVISDFLFAPTKTAVNHLTKEGKENNVFLSGDVTYDSFLQYQDTITLTRDVTQFKKNEFYLSTIHRPHNTNSLDDLREIFETFSHLDYPVILPIHPRISETIKEFLPTKNVHVIPPVGYLQMLNLLSECRKVITDSGGLQKEAYFLKVPCLTLREDTEWPETLIGDWNILVGANQHRILKGLSTTPDHSKKQENYFGDGKAAEHIIHYLKGRI